MNSTQILSRRESGRKVDFRVDPSPGSPYDQLRRLGSLLGQQDTGPDEIENCDEALIAYREYCYRKIYTSTTHAQFLEIDALDPASIDWAIAIHAVDAENYKNNRK
jgi:hypothetical protein